jgi:hypothetical protein
MIRKPTDWHPRHEGAAVRTDDAAVVTGIARLARRGGQFAVGMVLYSVALFCGYVAYTTGPGNLPTFIGIGAMAAITYGLGRWAFLRALATPD